MWTEKEDGWEVVLRSLMLGRSVPGPGPERDHNIGYIRAQADRGSSHCYIRSFRTIASSFGGV